MKKIVVDFLEALKGQNLTSQEAYELAYALHAATVDTPEFMWVTKSFEDVADEFAKADTCYLRNLEELECAE